MRIYNNDVEELIEQATLSIAKSINGFIGQEETSKETMKSILDNYIKVKLAGQKHLGYEILDHEIDYENNQINMSIVIPMSPVSITINLPDGIEL